MDIQNLPFCITTWTDIQPTKHTGDSGSALWHTRQFGNIRVRMVEYSPDYLADHWCKKGHVLFCIEGELRTELDDGRVFVLKPGMSMPKLIVHLQQSALNFSSLIKKRITKN